MLDQSRNHIIRTFERARAARYNAYVQYVQTFPYYSLWLYHNGRPPLPPAQLKWMQDQMWSADENLRLGVDTDWRNACLNYPDTLDYYFSLVDIKFPKEKDDRVMKPEIGKRRIRRDSGHSEKGSRREKGRP